MWRLVIFLLAVLTAAWGLATLADRPGSLFVDWEGYRVETSVFHAVVIVAAVIGAILFVWSIFRQIWSGPAAVGHFLMKRRQRRGLDALSSGMIAVGAGDRSTATRYAIQARKSLPNEPLTHLLRAQAAQLSGDKATARRIFEAMLGSPDTEPLGLRGLYLEATREGEAEPARQFAERAHKLNPKLGWPVEALFDVQCRAGNWTAALETVTAGKRNGLFEKALADRRRAVLLSAQALALEDQDADKALSYSLEAHGLAPDLVPAAAVAGRLLASRGNTSRAAKVIQKTWARSPHPDLAMAYAYARIGDSTRDRMDRIKQLAAMTPGDPESAIAVATVAVEARFYDESREALAPLLHNRPSRRVCRLMARIEGEQNGDRGRMREWILRSATAAADPAWTADGAVSDHWAPTSPVTGALDAFRWRAPLAEPDNDGCARVADSIEEWISVGGTLDDAPETAPQRSRIAVAERADYDDVVELRENADPTQDVSRNSERDMQDVVSPNSATAIAGRRLAKSIARSRRAADQNSDRPTSKTTPAEGGNGTSGGASRVGRDRDTEVFTRHAPDDPGADSTFEFDEEFYEAKPRLKSGSET